MGTSLRTPTFPEESSLTLRVALHRVVAHPNHEFDQILLEMFLPGVRAFELGERDNLACGHIVDGQQLVPVSADPNLGCLIVPSNGFKRR